jgi:hypothetical protein
MGRTACTESQCLYKGALYLYLTVELYLYSPYGPYGLYRASVPVRGCTLPLPYSRAIPLLPLWAVRPVQNLSACTRVHFTLTFSTNKQFIQTLDASTANVKRRNMLNVKSSIKWAKSSTIKQTHNKYLNRKANLISAADKKLWTNKTNWYQPNHL